jgi:hypothetical protein
VSYVSTCKGDCVSVISPGSLVRRRDHPLTNDLSDTETVMLDIERGRYFGLRDVGKAIWEALASQTTVDEICDQLMGQFEVELDTCRREVSDFLQQLHDQGLIEVHDDGSAA